MSKNLSPNIAVIKLSALGDIVHAATVLQFIKKHLPQAKITWFADAKFCSFARKFRASYRYR